VVTEEMVKAKKGRAKRGRANGAVALKIENKNGMRLLVRANHQAGTTTTTTTLTTTLLVKVAAVAVGEGVGL
jgi:hypothetical protein